MLSFVTLYLIFSFIVLYRWILFNFCAVAPLSQQVWCHLTCSNPLHFFSHLFLARSLICSGCHLLVCFKSVSRFLFILDRWFHCLNITVFSLVIHWPSITACSIRANTSCRRPYFDLQLLAFYTLWHGWQLIHWRSCNISLFIYSY